MGNIERVWASKILLSMTLADSYLVPQIIEIKAHFGRFNF